MCKAVALGVKEMRVLCDNLISKYYYLTWLNLRQCNLNDEACRILGASLSLNQNLRLLILNSNPKITADGLESLCHGLKNHRRMEYLQYINNTCTIEHAHQWSEFFKSNSKLKRIILQANGIESHTVITLFILFLKFCFECLCVCVFVICAIVRNIKKV